MLVSRLWLQLMVLERLTTVRGDRPSASPSRGVLAQDDHARMPRAVGSLDAPLLAPSVTSAAVAAAAAPRPQV